MEQWTSISGFSDYEISSQGKIKSKERVKLFKNGRKMHFESKCKKQRTHPGNGFLMTDLINDSGKRKTVYPHKLVAQSFIKNEKPRKNKVVIHLDDNLDNNCVENLRWTSYSESIKIGFINGKRDNSDLWVKRRLKYGPKGGNYAMGRPDPLTHFDKEKMVSLRHQKQMSLTELAILFKCSVSHVHKTLKRMQEVPT
jgi:hypothetical protein